MCSMEAAAASVGGHSLHLEIHPRCLHSSATTLGPRALRLPKVEDGQPR